jgi:hypothetical protein
MPRARDIISIARVVAVWLLMLSMFLDPAGWRESSAFGPKSCEAACPCDEAPLEQEEDHDDCDDEHDEQPAGHDEQPAGHDEQCPDDCPSCGCGPGVAMTIVAVTLPTTSLPSSSEGMLVQADAPTSGVRSGVFRPPRSSS